MLTSYHTKYYHTIWISIEVIEVVIEVAIELLDSKQEDYDIVNIYI